MNMKKDALGSGLKIALSAIFGALAAAVTMSFVIPIPATSGYFNLGEGIVYLAALVFGPFIGGFTGGSIAIADILVPGAAQFAPGTLVIKCLEGILVGFINKILQRYTSNRGLSASISVFIGGLEMVVGYFVYEQLFLGYSMATALVEVLPNVVQMVIGLIVAVPIMYVVLRVFPQLRS